MVFLCGCPLSFCDDSKLSQVVDRHASSLHAFSTFSCQLIARKTLDTTPLDQLGKDLVSIHHYKAGKASHRFYKDHLLRHQIWSDGESKTLTYHMPGSKVKHSLVKTAKPSPYSLERDPRVFVHFAVNIANTVQYVSLQDYVVKFPQTKLVFDDNKRCVLRCKSKENGAQCTTDLTIDKTRNYLISEIRYEIINDKGTTLRESVVESWIVAGNSNVFPERVRWTAKFNDSPPSDDTFHIRALIVNDPKALDDAQYQHVLTDTALVGDMITGTKYTVNSRGDVISPPEPLRKDKPPEAALPAGSDTMDTPSQVATSKGMSVATIIGLFVVFALMFYLIRRKYFS
jgi:hypothetical protein